MLANHTRHASSAMHWAPLFALNALVHFAAHSIRHLFQRCLTQYDKLMRRKAFLDNYEQHAMFKVRPATPRLASCADLLGFAGRPERVRGVEGDSRIPGGRVQSMRGRRLSCVVLCARISRPHAHPMPCNKQTYKTQRSAGQRSHITMPSPHSVELR